MSLFTGIAGLDLGLERAGLQVVEMCESWEPARRVLRTHFASVPLSNDVATMVPSAAFEVLAGGFPCTDLSLAGKKAGILGVKSGLIEEMFRVAKTTMPEWIVIENVPNLLSLHSGKGMALIITRLEALGYRWAYRTVDTRATGLPQRRPRVFILASLNFSPEARLLSQSFPEPSAGVSRAGGFYWTEGRYGVGFVEGSMPTLKGGSTVGIVSAPALWRPSAKAGRKFVLPSAEDGEALQGLPRGWTARASIAGERDMRWKLIGNAVSVGVGEWVGSCIEGSFSSVPENMVYATRRIDPGARWPASGFGGRGEAWQSDANWWPMRSTLEALDEVIDVEQARSLSHRAVSGFLSRLDESRLAVPSHFYADLEEHMRVSRPAVAWPSEPGTRARMSAQKQKNTSPEVSLRAALRKKGFRGYRLQVRPFPEMRIRVDLAFVGLKVAVDVRGCFWHRCETHSTKPRANAERWASKLAANVDRDLRTVTALEQRGWKVVVVWEHEAADEAAERVASVLRERKREVSDARAARLAPVSVVDAKVI